MADADVDPFIIASFNHKFPVHDYPNMSVRKETTKLSAKKSVSNYRMKVDGIKMEYISDCQPSSANSSTNNGGADWCLMIKNKHTGEVFFKPAKFVIFNPDLGHKIVEEDEKAATVVDKSNFREKRDLLTLKYGSKQKKRALEAKMGSAISKDSLSNMISSAVKQVKESSETLLNSSLVKIEAADITTVSPTKRASAVLPCFNPEATSPGEIYDMNDIISPNDFILVSNEAAKFSEFKTTTERKAEGYSDIILDLCLNLPAQIEARRTRCVYVLYLHYLINLFKFASDKRNFSAKDFEEAFNVPTDVRAILFERYTVPSARNGFHQRTLSSESKDKLLAHCCVLLLNLNQFTFSLSKLLVFTSATDAKLSTICKLLGCTVKRSNLSGEKTVVLSSPPKPSSFGSDRKRKRRN